MADADLERELTCGICLEYYKEPLQLPCLHSFCSACLAMILDTSKGKRLLCPDCRHAVDLAKHGLKGLQKNFKLASIVDFYQRAIAATSATTNISQAADDNVADSTNVPTSVASPNPQNAAPNSGFKVEGLSEEEELELALRASLEDYQRQAADEALVRQFTSPPTAPFDPNFPVLPENYLQSSPNTNASLPLPPRAPKSDSQVTNKVPKPFVMKLKALLGKTNHLPRHKGTSPTSSSSSTTTIPVAVVPTGSGPALPIVVTDSSPIARKLSGTLGRPLPPLPPHDSSATPSTGPRTQPPTSPETQIPGSEQQQTPKITPVRRAPPPPPPPKPSVSQSNDATDSETSQQQDPVQAPPLPPPRQSPPNMESSRAPDPPVPKRHSHPETDHVVLLPERDGSPNSKPLIRPRRSLDKPPLPPRENLPPLSKDSS